MRIAILATYTSRIMMEMLVFVPVLLLILFGITAIAIGGYYLFRIIAAHLRGEPIRASRERAVAAGQASELARLALACGPLLSIALGAIPFTLILIFDKDSDIIKKTLMFLTIVGVGAVAGIIAGGAFWVCSALMRPVRKAANRLRGVGVWDPDLDGMP